MYTKTFRTLAVAASIVALPLLLSLNLLCVVAPVAAQMVTGKDMPGYAAVFRLGEKERARDVEVVQTACSVGPNVLWPGEKVALTFRLTNKTDQTLKLAGRAEVIAYATSVPEGDIWVPHVSKIADVGSVTVSVTLPPKGSMPLTVTPPVPARYGGYALVFDFGAQGRAFGGAFVRALKPDPGREWTPTFALDMPRLYEMSPEVARLFQRLGVKGCRMEWGYFPTTDPEYSARWTELKAFLDLCRANDVTAMLTLGAGSAPQPLGRGRPWLNPDDSMKERVKEDLSWLPQYDADFQEWVTRVASAFGWPRGALNALELWNEPWEGVSISGWGADLPRYRELYERMARGVVAARQRAGVKVLIGGTSSSSNTLDKLFADGSDRFLPWLDFCSIHYQELSAIPSLIPEWRQRRSSFGPVRVWDTESWVANSEDRLAGVIASMRAQGQERTVGIFGGNVYGSELRKFDGKQTSVVQCWPPAAAVAAVQKFLGPRPFREVLFKNGLPWVFVFGNCPTLLTLSAGSARGVKPGKTFFSVTGKGSEGAGDDGTLVILGDLGAIYNRNRTRFRTVRTFKSAQVEAARQALDKLPPDAGESDQNNARQQLRKAEAMPDATLTLRDSRGEFVLYDFYGNPITPKSDQIIVPLNGRGYFLRTDGRPGSFARLFAAVKTAVIEGYQPVEVVLHDFTAPLEQRPPFRATLTNVLNRPISGVLQVYGGGVGSLTVRLAPHETRTVSLASSLEARPDNAYPVTAEFDAGRNGKVSLRETLHVNRIARRTITVDGRLDDWRGVLPQAVTGEGLRASLTETAWLPFQEFGAGVGKGAAAGYLAWDDAYFYFAAKIADDTPSEGGPRYETRNDDAYYYPATVTDRGETRTWPSGVRRFSYRTNPDLPSGNGSDNVQIAFNVLPPDKKMWWAAPPGVPARFMAYPDTDYEFALNPVGARYGGGTEIWRLFAPDVPRKHFYPRQPKAPIDGGPVKTGKLSITRQGGTRIIEAAIPWSEIPFVRARCDAGQPIKFSFRVNDDNGPALELAAGRSVSKDNFLAFHNDWATHWANEVEFVFEKKGQER